MYANGYVIFILFEELKEEKKKRIGLITVRTRQRETNNIRCHFYHQFRLLAKDRGRCAERGERWRDSAPKSEGRDRESITDYKVFCFLYNCYTVCVCYPNSCIILSVRETRKVPESHAGLVLSNMSLR